MLASAPLTVVETPEFLSTTRKLLTEEERAVLVDYLAHNPVAGDVIPETGGVASCAGDWQDVENAVALA
jgi:hypothetical protein